MLNRISKYNYKLAGLLMSLSLCIQVDFSNFSKSFFLWSVCEQKSAVEKDASIDGLKIEMPHAEQLSS